MFGFGKKRKEEKERIEAIKQRVDLCYSLLEAEAVALIPLRIIKPKFDEQDHFKLFLFVDAAIHALTADLLSDEEVDTFVFEHIFSATGVFKDFDINISPGIRDRVGKQLEKGDGGLMHVISVAEETVKSLVEGNYEAGELRKCLKP